MANPEAIHLSFDDDDRPLALSACLVEREFPEYWNTIQQGKKETHHASLFKRTSVQWIVRQVTTQQLLPPPDDLADAALASSFFLRSDLVLNLCTWMWQRRDRRRLRELYDSLYTGDSLLARRLGGLIRSGPSAWHLDLITKKDDRWLRYEEKKKKGEWLFERRGNDYLGGDLLHDDCFRVFDSLGLTTKRISTTICEEDAPPRMDLKIYSGPEPIPRNRAFYTSSGAFLFGVIRGNDDNVRVVRYERQGDTWIRKLLEWCRIIMVPIDVDRTAAQNVNLFILPKQAGLVLTFDDDYKYIRSGHVQDGHEEHLGLLLLHFTSRTWERVRMKKDDLALFKDTGHPPPCNVGGGIRHITSSYTCKRYVSNPTLWNGLLVWLHDNEPREEDIEYCPVLRTFNLESGRLGSCIMDSSLVAFYVRKDDDVLMGVCRDKTGGLNIYPYQYQRNNQHMKKGPLSRSVKMDYCCCLTMFKRVQSVDAEQAWSIRGLITYGDRTVNGLYSWWRLEGPPTWCECKSVVTPKTTFVI